MSCLKKIILNYFIKLHQGCEMLNTRYLTRLFFKLICATYFLSHGIQLSKKTAESSELATTNLQWIINSSTITLLPYYL